MATSATPTVLYRERVWPSIGVFMFFLAMALSMGVVFGEPYGFAAGVRAVGVSLCLVGLLVIRYSPLIKISASKISVGKASIPLDLTGKSFKVEKSDIRRVLNNAHTSSAYVQTSPGVKTAVIITVIDPEDPHPFWFISTRKPDAVLGFLKNI